IGVPWLYAGPFQYCGSIGPIEPEWCLQEELELLGNVIAEGCSLRGLFGIDGIRAESHLYSVEVNPRYTASMELLDYAGIPTLAWQRQAFDPAAALPALPSYRWRPALLAKAILYAPADLCFPDDGPWMAEVDSPQPVTAIPDFADIPYPRE